MSDVLRRYEPAECGVDGYPLAWRRGIDLGEDVRGPRIPDLVRELTGHRCVRCGHPYRTGQSDPEWSPCDEGCNHDGPLMIIGAGGAPDHVHLARTDLDSERARRLVETTYMPYDPRIEAKWRVLTVHHLTMEKADCRWWNLVALCQRCHLQIQGKVKMSQVYPFEHSEWFKPYAAGYYAATYQGRDLSRDEAVAEMDTLLSLERVA
jgi:hypothetical protein